MKLSEFKNHLTNLTEINFQTPNGDLVAQHFHVTEVGLTTKNFIDCGGTVRLDKTVSMQLWVEQDTDHRLVPEKLLRIIDLSKKLYEDENLELEVEYQTDTIGQYGLQFNGKAFVLTNKQTACLATDACGITPKQKQPIAMNVINSCTPGGGCC